MAEATQERNGTATNMNAKDKGEKKPLQRRALPSLAAMTGTSSMSEAAFVGRVDKSPTEWQLLPLFSMFSTADDGSYPMVKVSKSKAISCVDGKSYPVGSGRCYRIVLSNR